MKQYPSFSIDLTLKSIQYSMHMSRMMNFSFFKKILPFLSILLTVLIIMSCSDNPSNPNNEPEPDPNPDPDPEVTVGTLEINTITTGLDPNPVGYTVEVENQGNVQAGPNDTQTMEDIEEGTYLVELMEIEDHCTLESENPVSVNVVAEETAQVKFEVDCKGIFRDKIVFFRTTSQSALRYYQKGVGYSMAASSYYTMNYDGSDLKKAVDLTQKGQVYFDSDISPDGTKMVIAYSENVDGMRKNFRIAIVDAYNNEMNYLINESTDTHYFEAVFSPDGTKIAFTGRSDSGLFSDIYIMNIDGSNMVNVTNSEELERHPDWSPGGTQLVFQRSSTSYKYQGIFVINTDGSGLKLINKSDLEFTNPQWSPNGDKIAVVGSQTDPYYYQEIYVMNSDGSNPTMVTTSKAGEGIYYGSPKWSPDESKLLFTSNRDGDPDDEFGYSYVPMDIFTVNTDGSDLVNFTNTSNIGESNLMWSP